MSLWQGFLAGVNINTGLLTVLVGIAGTSLRLVIKNWPAIKALTISESERLRDDRRKDFKEVQAKLELVTAIAGACERHGTASSIRMGELEWIIGLLFDELELQPHNSALVKKGREMYSRLYPVPSLSAELEAIRIKLDPLHSPIRVTQ